MKILFRRLLAFLSLAIACGGQDEKAPSTKKGALTKIENLALEGLRKHNFPSFAILTNSGMGQPFGEVAEAINETAFNELLKHGRKRVER